MIIVTGANGFIGSYCLATLRSRGQTELLAVDVLRSLGGQGKPSDHAAEIRYEGARPGTQWLDMDDLPGWLERQSRPLAGIVHLGALSDTTLTDRRHVMRHNLDYTQRLWRCAVAAGCPFIYASSAATYGDGSQGYSDEADPRRFQPLNLYAESKHQFDLWALEQPQAPPRWAGLKFFNVYGPNEAHKGHMASVAFHAFHQATETGRVRLFRSHRAGIADGHQRRDFIYVADAVDAALHFLHSPAAPAAPNGLYNIGTGAARTFEDVALAVFAALALPPVIDYVPMPEHLRARYQYFTQATVAKLRRAGFSKPMASLESGVSAYVGYLLKRKAA